jgi:hypothetical protein
VAGFILSWQDCSTMLRDGPYGVCVHGNNDTVGATNAVDKVADVLGGTLAAT